MIHWNLDKWDSHIGLSLIGLKKWVQLNQINGVNCNQEIKQVIEIEQGKKTGT